jgi:clan AA aspartic protease (TIGR02281 family)
MVGFLSVADTLWMKSGRSSEVVILEETPEEVTFTYGVGSVTLPRTVIERIEYSAPQITQAQVAAWADQYFYHDPYVPEPLEKLAGIYRSLLSIRKKIETGSAQRRGQSASQRILHAVESRDAARMEALRERLTDQEPEYSKLRTAIHKLTQQVNANSLRVHDTSLTDSEYDQILQNDKQLRSELATLNTQYETVSSTYEKDRLELNALVLKWQSAAQKEKDQEAADKNVQSFVSAYLKERQAFLDELSRCDVLEVRADYGESLQKFKSGFEAMMADLQSGVVPVVRKGGVLMVRARVNGTADVTFIVDTGASWTTISRALATRLGLGSLDHAPKHGVLLADGTTVEAWEIQLDSIELGAVGHDKVSVLVLSDPPGPGVDGLLGMSFLKYFVFKMGADEHTIELTTLRD